MPRLTLTVLPDEREALLKLAQRERRDLQAQGALLIRRELERLGLLPRDPQSPDLPHDPQTLGVQNGA